MVPTNNAKSKNDKKDDKAGIPPPIKKRSAIVVKTTRRKRQMKTSKVAGMQRKKPPMGGLPSFQPKHMTTTSLSKNTTLPNNPAALPDDDGWKDDNEAEFELPSDCHMAIQTLLNSQQGLHIPMTHKKNTTTNKTGTSGALFASAIQNSQK